MYIVLVYDINIEENSGQKVLRNTFKICKKYLHHIQNSVFEGEVTKVQLERLKSELQEYIRKDKDSVIVFKTRADRWLEKEFWAKEEDLTNNFL
ncbi:CRISPR-associated endonuclease Cas2 [Defluviitalea phaphyphila]|uniref:CRISPR-associated endonuclease Cas2 n=1 Tax=Defluviitalea phaphyphila TaxID=1473580 RepID=UPI0007309291|nr:CRISPR-associated endonuclease Cas2 [Defluviitalea phaphyphila]